VNEYPPDTFCLSGNVFRPQPVQKVTPGLADRVQRLTGEGKFRSALDELFPILDQDPMDQEALRLAMIALGVPRTQQLQAPEPLGLSYWLDTRLDPVFAVCSHCQRSWVPHLLYFIKEPRVTNPIGMQCRACGYVVCRNCLAKSNAVPSTRAGDGLDVNFLSRLCPNCKKLSLGFPVFPTGRPPRQLERRPQPVSAVVVLREGPIAPDYEYMRDLLEPLSPDALQGNAHLIAVPVDSWPNDIGNVAMAILARHSVDGKILWDQSIPPVAASLTDENGLNVYILKVFAPSVAPSRPSIQDRTSGTSPSAVADPVQAVQRGLQGLRAQVAGRKRDAETVLLERLLDVLEKAWTTFSGSADCGLGLAMWSGLLDLSRLQLTCRTMDGLIRAALNSGRHEFQTRDGPDMFVMISAIPTSDAEEARQHFPGGYLSFLEAHQLTQTAQTKNVVHWIVCAESRGFRFHVGCFPVDTNATTFLPTELLSAQELAAAGLDPAGALSVPAQPSPAYSDDSGTTVFVGDDAQTILKQKLADLHNERGVNHFEKDQFDEAIAESRQAVEIWPNELYWMNLGNSLVTKGARERNRHCILEGIEALQQSLRIKPDFERAQKNLLLAKQMLPSL